MIQGINLTFSLETKPHEIAIIVSSLKSLRMIKTIAVIGATGTQGGGVVRELLKDPPEDPRHRPQPHTYKANAVSSYCIEIVSANLNSSETLNSDFEIRLLPFPTYSHISSFPSFLSPSVRY
jgi:hypothetical protein